MSLHWTVRSPLSARLLLSAAALALLAHWALVGWRFSYTAAARWPLHYTVRFGVDWLGGPWQFAGYPAVAAVAFLGHFLLWRLCRQQGALATAWLVSGTVVQVGLLALAFLLLRA